MKADIHNHTCHYSPDASETIDELMSSAVSAGISIVGITEHYEYDNPDPEDDITTFDIQSYSRSFEEWKNRCPEGLTLLMGIEFGYQTHTAAVIDETAQSAPFDLVILSNHLFRGRDVYYGAGGCYDLPKKERHKEYISKMAEMCEKVNSFDIAAHFDYINRYNPDVNCRLLYEDCPAAFDRFFEALISREKCLEINTRSIHKARAKGCPDVMPDSEIIRRYLAMGGKLISLGSDSHTPDTLGIYFDETYEYLRSLGVRELCYYKGRSPFTFSI